MIQRTAILCSLVALAATQAAAQANPRGEAKASLAGKSVAIEYGRPSLKGRDMLGEATLGTPWRLGADSATTLDTQADLTFGDVKLPKGAYILQATKVTDGQWQLNVHRPSTDSPGSPGEKVADVALSSSKLSESVEMFTIELRGDNAKGEFEMKWGTASMKASFSAK